MGVWRPVCCIVQTGPCCSSDHGVTNEIGCLTGAPLSHILETSITPPRVADEPGADMRKQQQTIKEG